MHVVLNLHLLSWVLLLLAPKVFILRGMLFFFSSCDFHLQYVVLELFLNTCVNDNVMVEYYNAFGLSTDG